MSSKCCECGKTAENRARNEEGEIVYICDNCYERFCEGYELIGG